MTKASSTRTRTRPLRLARRTFLRGSGAFGASTVWLPALEAMFNRNGTALADGVPIGKRFIEFFWGVSYSTVGSDRTWAPRADSGPLPATLPYYFNTDEKYQAKLKKLATDGVGGLNMSHLTPSLSDPDIRKYVRIIDGISTKHVVAESNQHWQTLLGVVSMPRGSTSYSSSNANPTGPSLDRFIGSFAPFRDGTAPRVYLGCCPSANYGGISLSNRESRVSIGFAGMKDGKFDPAAQILREQASWDPLAVFEQLFGSVTPGKSDPEARRRRSVLDGVLQSSAPTLARLSGRDKQLVEAHLDGIRQIEKNVGATTSCARIEAPKTARVMLNGKLEFSQAESDRTAPRVAKDMRDLAALMLSCDYTRCVTLILNAPLSGMDGGAFLDFSGATGARPVKSLHRDSHDAKPFHRLTTPWHMGQLAALIKSIEGVREGAGSAIDNTLIWATSENGPQVHSLDNIATLVAGGPKLVGGNHYQKPGDRLISDMHLGVLQSLGLPTTDYLAHVKPKSVQPIDIKAPT